VLGRQPFGEEIEPTPPARRADPGAPPRPSLDKLTKPEEPDDLRIRRIFQQPDSRPVAIQASKGLLSLQESQERRLVDVIVPDVGQTVHRRTRISWSARGERFATTHSPVVLAWLDEEDYKTTFLCRRDEESGASIITPLSEIPHLIELVRKQPIGELFTEGWLERAFDLQPTL
jgi:hypothetical protein